MNSNDMLHLHACRRKLLAARATERALKDYLAVVRAQAEASAIAHANGSLGKNAEERERNLLLALASDADYQHALADERRAIEAVETAQTELDIALDLRRAAEWSIRLRLVEALEGRVHPDGAEDDDCLDAVAEDAMGTYNGDTDDDMPF